MRPSLLAAALLAACFVNSAAATSASLTCPKTDDAEVARLCAALEEEMRQSGGETLPQAAFSIRLILEAQSPRPDTLRARLTVESAAGRHQGDEMVLSVMDRPVIPDSEIRDFARLLLKAVLPQISGN